MGIFKIIVIILLFALVIVDVGVAGIALREMIRDSKVNSYKKLYEKKQDNAKFWRQQHRKCLDSYIHEHEKNRQLLRDSPKWISVGDCLPENCKEVLVCGKSIPGVAKDFFSCFNGSFLVYGDGVEYWMSIPKAPVDYKEEGNECDV